MKKKIGVLSAVMILVLTTLAFAAPPALSKMYQSNFKYVVNGIAKPLPQGFVGIVYQNRNYVPIAFAAEALGATVSYDKGTNTITIDGVGGGVDKAAHEAQILNLNAQIKELNSKIAKLEAEKAAASAPNVQGTIKRLNGYELYNGSWYRIKADGSLDYAASYTKDQITSSTMYYNGYAYYNGSWYYVKNNGIMDYTKSYTLSEIQGNSNSSSYRGFVEYGGYWYKVKPDGSVDLDNRYDRKALQDQEYFYNGRTYRYYDGFWYPVLGDGKLDSQFPSQTPPGYEYYNWRNTSTNYANGKNEDAIVAVRSGSTSYDESTGKLKVTIDFQNNTKGSFTIRPDAFVLYDGNRPITAPEYNSRSNVKVDSDNNNVTVTTEFDNTGRITNRGNLELRVVYADEAGNLRSIPVSFTLN